jgi:hypothetical protein
MEIFILEDQMEKVVNPKTKEYLEEVVSCYRNGNYRASVVVLYTTLIFDLMQKLITLKDVYDEEEAKVIYNEIKQKQKNNPFDSSWEKDLIDKICKDMKIISKVEKEELEHLKKERNYAAHPIINEREELTLKPIRKETAGDLIRKAFEIVFLRDAILARDINIKIVEDLKEYYSRVAESGFEKYVNNRYLNRMNQARKNELFKFLWQSVFIWNDDDAIRNRDSNLLGLIYMYNGDSKGYQKIIKDNEDKLLNKIQVETFSSWCNSIGYTGTESCAILEFNNISRIMNFIKFIELNPGIYNCLNTYSKSIIQSSIKNMYVKKNQQGENFELEQEQIKLETVAIFLKPDHISENFDTIIKYKKEIYIREIDLDIMLKQAEFYGYAKEFRKFLIDYCTGAYSFEDAKRNFMYIELCKEFYEEEEYHYMLIKMNNNSQIYENYDKKYWLAKLEDMYGDKLVSTDEEEVLYYNLFDSVNKRYDIERVLDLIEKRVHLYNKDELWSIFNEINKEKTKNNISVQKDVKDYQNILSALKSMDKTVLYAFEEIFTTQ